MSKLPVVKEAIELRKAPPDVIMWVERQLSIGGYLASDQVNTIAGDNTLKALAEFKGDMFLEFPHGIGTTTIDALSRLLPKDKVSEQLLSVPTKSIALGRSGRSATLPIVGLVYENEEIIEGGRLSWGEMLRGFTRMPAGSATFGSEEQLVRNMIELAKVFRVIRDKFGSPIGINSSYRPYHLPIGASRSQHKYARALDMRPMNGDFKTLLEVMKSIPGLSIGLGQRLGFLHGDIRPGGEVIFSY